MTRTSWKFGALAGVAAAAVALGLAEVVAVLTGSRSAPLVAVGGVVVDHVPESLKQFAITLFGVHDKTALLIGTAVLLLAFAALIGALSVRWPAAGFAGIGLFAAIGVAAALTRPDAGIGAAFPALLGAAAAGATLWLLVLGPLAPAEVTALPAPSVQEEEEAVAGRRRFLRSGLLFIAGAAVLGFAGRLLSTRRSVSSARAEVRLPAPASPAPEVPAGADLRLADLSSYVTPNDAFYRIDTALVVPQVDPLDWSLRIHGRVRKEIRLSYADLLALPMIERYVTLACVSNEVGGDLIGNARWLGVPLKRLLDEAQPLDGADQVVGRSADGWTCGTPTEVLRDGRDAMLAVGMNGAPLPIEHGFPVRVVVPGLYGYVSATKWVVELEVTSFADYDAYWVPRGWSAKGPIKTQSRIDTPRGRGDLKPGPVTVAGVAWAQHRGIAKVEVQVDDAPWQEARVARAVSDDTWVQWSWHWEAESGDHVLRVRATDKNGETQTSQPAEVIPDGATGYHTVSVTVA
ncbi:molybdopterin-dependent oxidoreductase [Asanoa siamensis]|uniref:Oxidoreductase n=1 Tax=Asanoa siamensis TaxID=926357 RepID=A0ABQ4CNT7_9ACTN|nr:molybdopterin-dependent oxidoreductase [Asanoa siamensis]GIF72946.1 oxidoreductase [Asanoa siamensis]